MVSKLTSVTIEFNLNGQGESRREIVHLPTGVRKVKCVVVSVQDPESVLVIPTLLQENGFDILQENGYSILL